MRFLAFPLGGLLLAAALPARAQTNAEAPAAPRFYVGLGTYTSFYQPLGGQYNGSVRVPVQLVAGYQLRPRLAVQVGLAYSGITRRYAFVGRAYGSGPVGYLDYSATTPQRSASASVLARYLNLILKPIRVCQVYQPRFGLGKGQSLSLDQFKSLYGQDPFYEWFGLDNPLMYAAHKAAGGMTSIYRQIVIGRESLFRQMIRDSLVLESADVVWSYKTMGADNRNRTLSLDARIPTNSIIHQERKTLFAEWLAEAAKNSGATPSMAAALAGAVFEVRQGYKSKDSKRQNADIANAATALFSGYLPCMAVLSGQIDTSIMKKYQDKRWTVLTGTLGLNDPLLSTYDFARDIIGYDLEAFFQRHRTALQMEITLVLQALLTAGPATT